MNLTYKEHVADGEQDRDHIEDDTVVHVGHTRVEAAERVELGVVPDLVDPDGVLHFFLLDRQLVELHRNLL